MAVDHNGGNIQNALALEEHDGAQNAKRVAIVSGAVGNATVNIAGAATIYAVVNTTAAGVGNSMVTLLSGPNQIGSVTVSNPITLNSNITLNSSVNNIGFATVYVGTPTLYAVVNTGAAGVQNSMVTLNAGPNQIGSVTISNTINANVSLLNSVSNIGFASVTPVQAWPDPKTYIGLVTATPVGLVTTVNVGLTTLAPSPNYIGLASVNIGGTLPALVASTANIGSVSVLGGLIAITGNITLSNSQGYIGLVTATSVGLVTTVNVGLTTLAPSPNFIGLVTAWHGSNVTLNASAAFIGLATVIPTFNGDTTLFTAIYSGTGNSTLLVAPASNRFFIQNLWVSSLGRAEVEIRSGATTLIPFTSLSTTSGLDPHFGRDGLPSRGQADALVVNLNGAATIGIMAHVRFAP